MYLLINGIFNNNHDKQPPSTKVMIEITGIEIIGLQIDKLMPAVYRTFKIRTCDKYMPNVKEDKVTMTFLALSPNFILDTVSLKNSNIPTLINTILGYSYGNTPNDLPFNTEYPTVKNIVNTKEMIANV